MTILLLLDVVLGLLMLGMAMACLTSRHLFRAIVLFIVFGLLVAVVWGRLGAIDVALAEAAIGAGLTGALLLATWRAIGCPADSEERSDHGSTKRLIGLDGRLRPSGLLIGFSTTTLTIVIGLAMVDTPSGTSDVADAVYERLDDSGVSNPVTAVLLNFRAYDTLLEITVLVMALVASWALGRPSERWTPSAGPVLAKAIRWFAPAMILIAGYLLWRGAFAPGGAFQAGAILATVGVLYLVIGRLRPSSTLWLRGSIVLGVLVFLGMGLLFALLADGFLIYPAGEAKILILIIETASTISIGVILAALFLAGEPTRDCRR